MPNTAGEVSVSSLAIYSCGPPQTDAQEWTDQLDPIYNSNTGCSMKDPPKAMDDRDEWQKRVRKSVPLGRHDEDDDT